ncbi:MAG: tRNA (N6-threonylcarbamoyladenosine(37)-N6)-methyltransferase TrmO, partial [Chloroflexota bacterium]
MTETQPEMVLQAIGTVRNAVKDVPTVGFHWEDTVSEIEVEPQLAEALDGLEGFSHIIVIFWTHRTDRTRPLRLKIHPRGDADLPLTGLFATRSPHHPNPLGMTAVRLLQRSGNILKVQG